MKQREFPSINQFRNVVKHVNDTTYFQGLDTDGLPILNYSEPKPTLAFEGTVKLHGTNAAVAQVRGEQDVYCFSRSRKLTVTSDNMGFALYVDCNSLAFQKLFERITAKITTEYDKIHIYGEWCGQGVQKGVAISQLPKMFVIFKVLLVLGESETWFDFKHLINVSDLNQNQIYSIYQFPHWLIEIDFNQPELVQNRLVELTNAVEACCPVAKHFGVEGVGEGIVWSLISDHPKFKKDSGTWFKVKGEKHSESHVKTLAEVDTAKMKSVDEFTGRVVTIGRLEQVYGKMKEKGITPSQKETGLFLKAFFDDVVKEELDTMTASGLEPKDCSKQIQTEARKWYFNRLSQP